MTGGSFPALIWKSFVEKALEGKRAQGFPFRAPVRGGEARRPPRRPAHARQRPLQGATEVVYFAGTGPTKSANCLENEVQVPDVRRLALADAQARVEAQPLTAELVYKPAEPLQRPGIVVDQRPRRGFRSSYDRVLLVVSKATQGVIPNLVGRDLADARRRLKKLKLDPRISLAGASRARCWSRSPAPGSPRPRASRCSSSSLGTR